MDIRESLYLFFLLANGLMTLFFVLAGTAILMHRRVAGNGSDPSQLSLIVCTRNRAQLLRKYLWRLLEQEPAPGETIVIVDGSEDGSLLLLSALAVKHPQLRVVYKSGRPTRLKGKKAAMATGLARARFDKILVTDDDCCPASRSWVSRMAGVLTDGKEIVIGAAPLFGKETLFGKLAEMDGYYTASQFLGLACLGFPYMATGRNMLYRRSLYDRQGGFSSHSHLLSGDDDLLVNPVMGKKNSAVCLDQQALVFSEGKSDPVRLLAQKRRHVQGGFAYRFIDKCILGMWNLSFAGAYLLLIPACLAYGFPESLAIFAFFLLIRWIIFLTSGRRIGYRRLFLGYPIAEMMYFIFTVILGVSLIRKPDTWS